jgi:hypothetical protein
VLDRPQAMSDGLTVLAPIVPGREQPLRRTLEELGLDVSGRRLGPHPTRPHIHFPRCRLVHFARFAILDDPDRGPGRFRLLFSSNYDGSLDDHLSELVAATTGMDAIWGACEGYVDSRGFADFVRAHALTPVAFYIAFRGETSHRIRRSLDVRRRLEEHIDSEGPRFLADSHRATAAETWPGLHAELLASSPPSPEPLARIRRAAAILLEALALALRHGPVRLLLALRKVTASIDRLTPLRLFNRLTFNSMRPLSSHWSSVPVDSSSPCASLEAGDDIPSVNAGQAPSFDEEDAVTQNQLTLVTTIGPGGQSQVEAVMSLIDAYSRHLAPAGSLIGISTIHFVRWLVIDEGRRLMMLSDYDGSWEAYIDEFAEMILSGLDAIWGTALGYPAEGARDLQAFKRFLRCHQVPAAAFYSGYPESTVLNIKRDLPLEGAVSQGLRTRSTGGWEAHL